MVPFFIVFFFILSLDILSSDMVSLLTLSLLTAPGLDIFRSSLLGVASFAGSLGRLSWAVLFWLMLLFFIMSLVRVLVLMGLPPVVSAAKALPTAPNPMHMDNTTTDIFFMRIYR